MEKLSRKRKWFQDEEQEGDSSKDEEKFEAKRQRIEQYSKREWFQDEEQEGDHSEDEENFEAKIQRREQYTSKRERFQEEEQEGDSSEDEEKIVAKKQRRDQDRSFSHKREWVQDEELEGDFSEIEEYGTKKQRIKQDISWSILNERKRKWSQDEEGDPSENEEKPKGKKQRREQYIFSQSIHNEKKQFQDEEGDTSENKEKPEGKNQRREQYSSFSQRMMKSMGYTPGKGIGKYGTGIAEPISESIHKGRRGFGFTLEGLEKEDVDWELEEVNCENAPEWLTPSTQPVLTVDDMLGWIKIGMKKGTIEDETTFCDKDILKKILDGKTVFDNLSDKEFLDARVRSNPFEIIKGAIFQNRAAMKMANIDAVFDYMFTEKLLQKHKPHELLYFADICAGPGGFSEYILWRLKWQAKGFGFTLKDPGSGSDFKLEEFLAAPTETFDPHYGVGGYDGDGDITNTDNVTAFREYIKDCTDNQGVHFVMADGGISVEGQENIQEILTKQLVLCQYMCALGILRTGGHFVCKVFDMFTTFSVGLFYLLYRCFEQVCLFKPVTSRPANSERYIICKNLRGGIEAVRGYLEAVNYNLCELKNEQPHLDVIDIVPLKEMERDELFFSYVTAFNDSFGITQIINLKKLQYYVRNTNLKDTRQSEIRRHCLKLWKVPNIPRTAEKELKCFDVFNSYWEKLQPALQYKSLNTESFVSVLPQSLEFLKDLYSWKWMWALGTRQMLVSLGRSNVFFWDMKRDKVTFQRSQYSLDIPKETILEVEVVEELTGEAAGQKKLVVIYILDVVAIYGERLDHKVFKERQEYAKKLAKAVNKPCRRSLTKLKSKPTYRITELKEQLARMKLKEMKNLKKPIPAIPVDDHGAMVSPRGILFYQTTKDPWHLHLSKTKKQFYYYNGKTKESTYDCPQGSCASYSDQVLSRHLWIWKPAIYSDLCSSENKSDTPNTAIVDKTMLCNYIQNILDS